jgi:8-oxo-dGTP pyrophosphatase MutT (NUDIX family)
MFRARTTSVYVLWCGHVLLIQRAPNDETKPLWWEAPAGHVDVDCVAEDSPVVRAEALRELREETGICAEPEGLTFLPQFSTRKHLSYALVLNYLPTPPKVTLSHEHVKCIWVRTAGPYPYPLRHEVRRFLRDEFNT